MSDLAHEVLPLIRTRSDLHRWSAANAHGEQMHRGVGILERAMETDDPGEVYSVMNRAITSALKVVMRADDSSGFIGDPCRVADVRHENGPRRQLEHDNAGLPSSSTQATPNSCR